MDKKSKEQIKEVIEDLLKLRKEQFEKRIDDLIELDWTQSTFMGMKPKGTWLKEGETIEDDSPDEDNPFEENPFEDENTNQQTKKPTKKDLWSEYISDFDVPLIKLNNLLEVEEKKPEIIKIENNLNQLHNKKHISVKEFTTLYGFSSDWQKNRRGRIHDNLPYHQNATGGKITYIIKEIEIWFENNNIGR